MTAPGRTNRALDFMKIPISSTPTLGLFTPLIAIGLPITAGHEITALTGSASRQREGVTTEFDSLLALTNFLIAWHGRDCSRPERHAARA
jgi:hypothetical protein